MKVKLKPVDLSFLKKIQEKLKHLVGLNLSEAIDREDRDIFDKETKDESR